MGIIQSGSEHFNYRQRPEWAAMNNGSGAREFFIPVVFDSPFGARPEVVVSTSMLDSFGNTNLRYNLRATGEHPGGFTLLLSTWSNTRLFMVGASWIAFDSRLSVLDKLKGLSDIEEPPYAGPESLTFGS